MRRPEKRAEIIEYFRGLSGTEAVFTFEDFTKNWADAMHCPSLNLEHLSVIITGAAYFLKHVAGQDNAQKPDSDRAKFVMTLSKNGYLESFCARVQMAQPPLNVKYSIRMASALHFLRKGGVEILEAPSNYHDATTNMSRVLSGVAGNERTASSLQAAAVKAYMKLRELANMPAKPPKAKARKAVRPARAPAPAPRRPKL